MSDYEFLKRYLEEEPEAQPQGASNEVQDFLSQPLGNAAGAVQVKPGEKVEEKINQEKKKSTRSLFQTASNTKKKTEKVLGAAVPDLGDMPTPPTGGIGLLVFISLLVVFAITPTKKGPTRLSLLWGAFLGNQSLPNDTPPRSGGFEAPPGFSPSIPYIPGPLDVLQGVLD